MRDSFQKQVEDLEKDWAENPRWAGTVRDYSAEIGRASCRERV